MPNKAYYNPVDDVLQGRVGRKLSDPGQIPRPFESYNRQLRSGEVMYMGLMGGLTPPKLVAWVGNKATYEMFYNKYYSGMYTEMAVYALPTAAAAED